MVTASGLPPASVDAPPRLTPEMASRKLLALAFIERYLAAHPRGPSYGEIAGHLGGSVTKDGARKIVQRLTKDGLIVRTKGAHRGIALPGTAERAAAVLAAEGWNVDPETRSVHAGTNRPLTLIAELDHDPNA